MKNIILILNILIFSLQTNAVYGQWIIEDGYTITFEGSGAEGTFTSLSGNIVFDAEDLSTARFNVQVDPSTIDTGNDLKDKHARGDKWFNVKKFAEVTFSSTKVEKQDNGYILTGMLLLHGIEKEIQLPFTFDRVGDKGVFKGGFSIEREAFGIMGPFFSFMVGETFEVHLEVPVRKKQ